MSSKNHRFEFSEGIDGKLRLVCIHLDCGFELVDKEIIQYIERLQNDVSKLANTLSYKGIELPEGLFNGR